MYKDMLYLFILLFTSTHKKKTTQENNIHIIIESKFRYFSLPADPRKEKFKTKKLLDETF